METILTVGWAEMVMVGVPAPPTHTPIKVFFFLSISTILTVGWVLVDGDGGCSFADWIGGDGDGGFCV